MKLTTPSLKIARVHMARTQYQAIPYFVTVVAFVMNEDATELKVGARVLG